MATIEGMDARKFISSGGVTDERQARRNRFASALASPDSSVNGGPTLTQLRAAVLSTPKSGNFGSPLPASPQPQITAPTTVTDPWAGMTNQQMNAAKGNVPSYATPTPSQTQTVPGPLAEPSAPQGQSVDALRDLSGQELEAALAAIESQYGLTREQLMQDQSELGATYRFLFSNLERQRAAATQGVTGEALQRGILRSGIHQGNVADVEQQFSEQTAQAEAAKQSRLFQINQALAALGPQQQLAQAQAASQISGGQLALEQQLAALGQLANR